MQTLQTPPTADCAEHTPTPWTTDDFNIFGANDALLASQESVQLDYETCAANAEFIVRAVNAHDALVAAAEQALWHWGSDSDRRAILDAGGGWKTDTFDAVDQIRAALRLARGA